MDFPQNSSLQPYPTYFIQQVFIEHLLCTSHHAEW